MITIKQLFEMSNLRPADTGLSVVIWLSVKGNTKHGPRIKVCSQTGNKISVKNLVTVTVENNPRIIGKHDLSIEDVNKIKTFIELNKNTIIKYWNSKISTREMLDNIKTITE